MQWGTTVAFLEHADKIADIVKTGLHGCFRHGKTGLRKQFCGVFQAQAVQIIGQGHIEILFKIK